MSRYSDSSEASIRFPDLNDVHGGVTPEETFSSYFQDAKAASAQHALSRAKDEFRRRASPSAISDSFRQSSSSSSSSSVSSASSALASSSSSLPPFPEASVVSRSDSDSSRSEEELELASMLKRNAESAAQMSEADEEDDEESKRRRVLEELELEDAEAADGSGEQNDVIRRRMKNRKLPPKTTCAAAFLLLIGIVFGSVGLGFLFSKTLNDALPFLVIGGIAFLPGSYASTILFLAWKRVPGFSFDQLPSYDEY